MAVARESAELPVWWRRYHDSLARKLAAIISQQAGLLCQVQGMEQEIYTGWHLRESLPPLAVAAQRLVVRGGPATADRLPVLFCFQSELAQVLVDRLLGGRGRWPGGARLLTALEAKVMRPLLLRLWEATGEAWPVVAGLAYEPAAEQAGGPPHSPLPGELRSARELLARYDPTWRWWVARFAVQLPAGRGLACLCLPFELLDQQAASAGEEASGNEPEVHPRGSGTMEPAGDSQREEAAAEDQESEERRADQTVAVAVVLGRVRLQAHDLLGLECGDIIKLAQPVEGEVTVYVNGRPAWLAQPGTFRGRLAVRLLREHAAAKEVVSA